MHLFVHEKTWRDRKIFLICSGMELPFKSSILLNFCLCPCKFINGKHYVRFSFVSSLHRIILIR